MTPPALPPVPASLKSVQHYLKVANDYDARDPSISRLHALQQGMTLKKSKEDMGFLLALMDWLEKTKQNIKSQETISDEMVAQAHLENVALKLFHWADSEDRTHHYTKNIVKAFYTAGMLLDVCSVFGDLNEDVAQQRKYAKWRAAHLHNCLNTGETPSEPAPKPYEEDTNDSVNSLSGISSDNLVADNLCLENDLTRLPSTSIPIARPIVPSAAPAVDESVETSLCVHKVTPEQIVQAQKLVKFAASALTYEDVSNAIDNLQKALRTLQTGQM